MMFSEGKQRVQEEWCTSPSQLPYSQEKNAGCYSVEFVSHFFLVNICHLVFDVSSSVL